MPTHAAYFPIRLKATLVLYFSDGSLNIIILLVFLTACAFIQDGISDLPNNKLSK